ncbi:MAG: M3 family metallopeptidase [Pseudomonadota bacterium]
MTNPLLENWTTPFGLPPFDRIEDSHFRPAFEAAMTEQRAEWEAIATDPATPTFENTMLALQLSGHALDKVGAVFWNLSASHTNPELQAIEREIGPKLTAHFAAMRMDPRLWARVKAVLDKGGLEGEEARVAELYRRLFVRGGADLAEDKQTRLRGVLERLTSLGTAFSQTVLKDEADWVLWLGEGDLDGLPDFLVAAAAEDAKARGGETGHAITLSRSSVEPFLTFSTRRDLRETAWKAWTGRGEASNWPLVAEMLTLRAEQAGLLGHPDFAAFKLEHQMAKSSDRVRALLMRVWQPARAKAEREAAALQDLAAEEGANITLAPWDWRFYAEKLRKRDHDLDAAEVKPFLPLDGVIEAAFDVAGRLFGLSFRPVDGVALHHTDARAWEVLDRDGAHLALFVGDYFARPSKRSGAWMSGYRSQQKLRQPERPIVMNTCNFAKGDPCLLSWDDALTLFHEFGHALHGMLSDLRYPMISGTSVARDFVELPSQLFEHWLEVPEILERHARHHQSGAPMPKDLIDRIEAARTFNQGFQTVEYVASALVDLDMHVAGEVPDPQAKQAQTLAEIGMPAAIAMRHATPHFQHVFAGDGYSAGYYSYMWSEVMDADAFRAFEEAGDPFDGATAAKLRDHIYAAGGRREPEAAYRAFRGALPGPEALLEGRGLVETAA